MTGTGMVGADTGQLRIVASSFEARALTLGTLEESLGRLVSALPWKGHDAEEFARSWHGTHRPSLRRISGLLEDSARLIRDNAEAQDATSEAVGSRGLAGDSAPGDSTVPGDGDRPGDPGLDKSLGAYEPLPPTIPLDDEALSPESINQGQVGDCWLLAALGTVAADNPQFIRDHLWVNPDGTWTVKMYDDGHPVCIQVTPRVPENSVGAADGTATWAAIYEKAAAEYFGGDYSDIDGGFSDDAYRAITGQSAERSGELSLEEIRDRLDGGPVALGTEDDEDWMPFDDEVDDSRIVPNHAYMVDRVEERDGRLMVHVLNPWGPDGGKADGEHKAGDLWLTEQQYRENFDSVYSTSSTR